MAASSKKPRAPKVRLSRSEVIARQVRMARAALGMTMAQFGKLVGLSANTIRHIEHAYVTLSRTIDGLEAALRDVPAIEWLPDTGESIGIRLHYSRLNEPLDPAPRIYALKQGRGIPPYHPDELKRGMIGSDYPLEKLMKESAEREKRFGRDRRLGKRSNVDNDARVPDASTTTSTVRIVILKAVAEQRIADGENPILVWREYRQMSLTTLAKKLRIAKGFLSQIETGKRRVPTKLQHKIARALGIKLEKIFPASSTNDKSASVPAVLPSPTGLTNEPGVPTPGRQPKLASNSTSVNQQYLEHLARQEGIPVEKLIDGLGKFYAEKNAEMRERKSGRG